MQKNEASPGGGKGLKDQEDYVIIDADISLDRIKYIRPKQNHLKETVPITENRTSEQELLIEVRSITYYYQQNYILLTLCCNNTPVTNISFTSGTIDYYYNFMVFF